MGTARRTSAERDAPARRSARRATQRPQPGSGLSKSQTANGEAAEPTNNASANASAPGASTGGALDPMQAWSQWWAMMTPPADANSANAANSAAAVAFAPGQVFALQQDYVRELSQ